MKLSKARKLAFEKYALYEKSVQSPEVDVSWFMTIFKDLRDKEPVSLREDFCGTFKVACNWVTRGPEKTAIGVDLDAEPLAYGKMHHYPKLTTDQKKRLSILQQNVLSPPKTKADVVVVGNFSFYIFQERALLRKYFKAVLGSMTKDGLLILEMSGGPGMIEKTKDRRRITKKGKTEFTYIWDQREFEPIHNRAQYSIHFKFPNGKMMEHAFTYDWRLWSIQEVREIMEEAGFSRSVVYWETEHKGEGTGEYAAMEAGDNAYSWISYVVGVK